jgi:Leucine-rich repeat (LRR) protein
MAYYRFIDGRASYCYSFLDDKSIVPDDAFEFSCGGCKLTVLPKLPINLKELQCYHNNLIELPELPPTLFRLDCGYNKLIELPELPITLNYLYCTANNLTEIPKLPNSLILLYCARNNIKYLSFENCLVIKSITHNNFLKILDNPVSAGFTKNSEFQESL